MCMNVCVCELQRKTSSLESYKIQSSDGCSWKAVVRQGHNCVGGPGGHLGPSEHSAVLNPAFKCVFLAEIYVSRSMFGVSGTCVRASLNGLVWQGGFHSKGSLTEMDKAEASSSGDFLPPSRSLHEYSKLHL